MLPGWFDEQQQAAYASVDWERAACRGLSPSVFYPELRGLDLPKLDRIRSVCSGCPIRDDCREYGRRFENHGVWGGVAMDDRLNDLLHRKMTWHIAKTRWLCAGCRVHHRSGTKYRKDSKTGARYCEDCST